ncbi:hypothetical protein EMIHUDRAFT_110951 [Emiliania huxleyi CCMP1516]|uniref:Glycoside-hydrolase family GH114 TIM-barrel domain-containing protein n=2 Tax=Emiliania huxleyi TaxID=2903 RepID=A0A0D3KH72_EMIH1|nr:hypothetical protein EMIHUDRAFT_110951 [Emiliania huxleyi CCMP1516]EOD35107.1 hypothetical protein EMIHUDRAFT_110951 [Emiliania huxleyi CCMP1516]|eukprot:XP_005787536.1 hypothetical protein EMIHUDRAFT_110951 [Emiliania huxleyi CCMP1516]
MATIVAAALCAKVGGDAQEQPVLWCDHVAVDEAACPPKWLQKAPEGLAPIVAVTAYHVSLDGSLGVCGDNSTVDGSAYRMCEWKGDESPEELLSRIAPTTTTFAAVYNDMSAVEDPYYNGGFGLYMLRSMISQREAFISKLVSAVVKRGAHGVTFDLELCCPDERGRSCGGLLPTTDDSMAYARFLSQLGDALHTAGKLLHVMARQSCWQDEAILVRSAKSVDRWLSMTAAAVPATQRRLRSHSRFPFPTPNGSRFILGDGSLASGSVGSDKCDHCRRVRQILFSAQPCLC